jgi:hypothetical protein
MSVVLLLIEAGRDITAVSVIFCMCLARECDGDALLTFT